MRHWPLRPAGQPGPRHAEAAAAQHLLGHVEVADDPVAERPHGDDARRRPADHPLRLGADREHVLRLGVDRDDAGLADDDAAVADVHERVGGPEVDRHVVRRKSQKIEKAHVGLSSLTIRVGGRGMPGPPPDRAYRMGPHRVPLKSHT